MEDAFALAPASHAARVAPASAWPAPSRFGRACLLFRLVVHLNPPLLIPSLFRSHLVFCSTSLPLLVLALQTATRYPLPFYSSQPNHRSTWYEAPLHPTTKPTRPPPQPSPPSCLQPANSPVPGRFSDRRASLRIQGSLLSLRKVDPAFRPQPASRDKRLLNRTDPHRTRTAMARSPPRSSAPSCARSARTPASRSCRT